MSAQAELIKQIAEAPSVLTARRRRSPAHIHIRVGKVDGIGVPLLGAFRYDFHPEIVCQRDDRPQDDRVAFRAAPRYNDWSILIVSKGNRRK